MIPLLTPSPCSVYGLFISHAWNYSGHYDGMVKLLNTDSSFRWTNLSVPIDNPIKMPLLFPKSNRCIVRQLEERINQADCLLVFAAMYVPHRGWIQSEVEAAQEFNKPIIAIRPQAQERIPEALQRVVCCDPVGWNRNSIISAILRYSVPRHSATGLSSAMPTTDSDLPRSASLPALSPPRACVIPTIGPLSFASLTPPPTTGSLGSPGASSLFGAIPTQEDTYLIPPLSLYQSAPKK
jgi:hypothetical protein